MSRSGTTYYYHANRLGSVYLLSNGTAGIEERYSYTPYGVATVYSADYSSSSGTSAYDRLRYERVREALLSAGNGEAVRARTVYSLRLHTTSTPSPVRTRESASTSAASPVLNHQYGAKTETAHSDHRA